MNRQLACDPLATAKPPQGNSRILSPGPLDVPLTGPYSIALTSTTTIALPTVSGACLWETVPDYASIIDLMFISVRIRLSMNYNTRRTGETVQATTATTTYQLEM